MLYKDINKFNIRFQVFAQRLNGVGSLQFSVIDEEQFVKQEFIKNFFKRDWEKGVKGKKKRKPLCIFKLHSHQMHIMQSKE